MENAKVIPFVFWQNNFVQNSIIPMVFSGTEIRLKAATWPAMNFFAGNIHLMLHSGQVGSLNRDNDDGILWQIYFARNATIFLWFFQERKFDQRYQHDLCLISSRVNWRCYIWIKSANLIEHNHCDIESWYNSNADSRWKTQKWFRLYFDKTIFCRILLFRWSFLERKLD